MNFLERVQRAREEFTFFYNRGISEPDRWHRQNSMYFMWSLYPDKDKDNGQLDYAIVNIWEHVINDFHLPVEKVSLEELMLIFDLMEKYAKLWIFS